MAPGLLRRWRRFASERLDEARLLALGDLFRGVLIALATATLIVSAVGYLSALLAGGSVDAIAAGLALVATMQLGARVHQVVASVSAVSESVALVWQVLELSAPEPSFAGRAPVSEVRLHAVTFSYAEANDVLLRDVEFSAHRGEVIAIIGASGSGKSTLVKLLSGLYEPTSGVVEIRDGESSTFAAADRRARVAAVFQDFTRFQLSVRESVSGLDSNFTVDDVNIAVEAAAARDVIARMPEAIDTRLGTQFGGGLEISTGEWQRIAIARALCSARDVLVLDEPTASLDDDTATLVGSVLARQRHRTVIVMTHDPRMVAYADRTYELRGGVLVPVSGRLKEETVAGDRATN